MSSYVMIRFPKIDSVICNVSLDLEFGKEHYAHPEITAKILMTFNTRCLCVSAFPVLFILYIKKEFYLLQIFQCFYNYFKSLNDILMGQEF